MRLTGYCIIVLYCISPTKNAAKNCKNSRKIGVNKLKNSKFEKIQWYTCNRTRKRSETYQKLQKSRNNGRAKKQNAANKIQDTHCTHETEKYKGQCSLSFYNIVRLSLSLKTLSVSKYSLSFCHIALSVSVLFHLMSLSNSFYHLRLILLFFTFVDFLVNTFLVNYRYVRGRFSVHHCPRKHTRKFILSYR